ncbi:MAG: MmgE/PrpD family protein [Acidobacteria bacterium]|jgi:2-methylcitrate dehydratase PrpD|nr:MmgE/PrpD family protein [Acidobacteriota bacterium]
MPMLEPISLILAEHVTAAKFEDLSQGAIEATKKSLLDAIGVTLAASGLGEGCKAFVDLAVQAGGTPESTIIGFGIKVPASMAALANGAMAHALDFEDAFDNAPIHPNAAVVAAALPVAQSVGSVSGRELIAALATGCDLVCRLGLSLTVNPDIYGWYPPPILGAFGATAAAAKLMKLDAAQTRDAFSLTLCQATCSSELKYSRDSMIRAVRDAFAAQAGVLAAKLAGSGVKGFDQPFEGKAGFFQLYAKGAYEPFTLLADLGKKYWGEEVSYKPWPSCRGTHPFIEALLALRQEHGLRAEDIAEIKLSGGPLQKMLVEPLSQKQSPATAIDAKFSLPFTAACALVYGAVRLDHFLPVELRNPDIARLALKVSYEIAPGKEQEWRNGVSGITEVRTVHGRVYTASIDYALGHPRNPIRHEALCDKFLLCAGQSARPRSRQKLESLINSIKVMESVEDVGQNLIDAHL